MMFLENMKRQNLFFYQMERKVFQCGQIGLNDFQKWETRETEKLKTSDMVMFHRKRKRVQMEDS